MAEGVLEARNRISSHLLQTPLILSDWYSKRVSERAGKPTRVRKFVFLSLTEAVGVPEIRVRASDWVFQS